MSDAPETPAAPEAKPRAPQNAGMLARLRRIRARVFGPWERASERVIEVLSATEERRGRSAIILALALNLTLLTFLSTFARVRIYIPNAPSDTIQITLVEPLALDLPLRDPELEPLPEPELEEEEPEPEPEPEIIEAPEPEPEPEPDPVPEPEEPSAEPEPEPEPEAVEEEPEPELNLDLEPQFAPPADAPEPLIPDPAPAAEDDLALPEPEPAAPEQTPEPEAEQPLVAVEPDAGQPESGLDDILGSDETQGEDEAVEEDEGLEPEEEEPAFAETPTGDDMFDEEPVFGRRTFILPQVALPSVDFDAPLPEGEAAILPGESGVVAIFCPEQFDDEDKQRECAGRREIRSGWRPGASGEDWSRATELLQRDRNAGQAGPAYGPAARALQRQRDEELLRELRDPRRSADDINDLADTGDDNILRGVEGDRPDIGPRAFEPSWTLRDRPEGISEEDLRELEEAIQEANPDPN